jgi:sec-independent protein translocase protein TatC
MFLLTKAFRFRDQSNPDGHEKPFLEHLEDLRVMVTRIVVTLLVATIACYALKDSLMDLLRQPIEAVWEQNQQDKLPEEITPDVWEQAKRSSNFIAALSPAERQVYFQQFSDPDLPFYTKCAGYYRAARSIDDHPNRLKFIESLPQISEAEKAFTLKLLEDDKNLPNAQIDAKNNVVYMRSLKPTETFMLSLKLAFFAGVIVSFPLILAYILQFVVPGLKENEKKALWPALVIGFGLFLAGIFFCYFMVLPKALEFFYTYSMGMGVENEWRIGDYITFATQFTLIFGLAFELPVVVMTLVKIGLLDYEVMSRTRSYAIVSIFVIAAIITPTGDALTLSMLAAPMCLLYEICIWFAYFTRKKELEEEAAELAEYESQAAPRIAAAPGSLASLEVGDIYADDHDHDDLDYHDEDDEGEEFDDGTIPTSDMDQASELPNDEDLDSQRPAAKPEPNQGLYDDSDNDGKGDR